MNMSEEVVLLEKFCGDLDLEIVFAGRGRVTLTSYSVTRPGLQFAGFFKYFDSSRILVLGNSEYEFLRDLPQDVRRERIKQLLSYTDIPCIILARAESYASCNKPLYSMLDGVSIGLGFTGALCLIGIVREFLAGGAFAGISIPGYPAMSGVGASAFGFIVFGCLMALFNFVIQKINERKDKMKAAVLPLSEGKVEPLKEVAEK